MSVHSDLNYDASRAHRRGRGDKPKNDIFLLVTTRLIVSDNLNSYKIVLVSLARSLAIPW